jgi:hypothetical protein
MRDILVDNAFVVGQLGGQIGVDGLRTRVEEDADPELVRSNGCGSSRTCSNSTCRLRRGSGSRRSSVEGSGHDEARLPQEGLLGRLASRLPPVLVGDADGPAARLLLED